MAALLAVVLFFAAALALAWLFVASATLRSIIRESLPEHEATLLLPASNWYLPQNFLGHLKPMAIYRRQPPTLQGTKHFPEILRQVRILAAMVFCFLGAVIAHAVVA